MKRRPPKSPRTDPLCPYRTLFRSTARDPIGGRLDLHGMTQDRARATLDAFLRRAWDDGTRAVLVITGKSVQGDGVLRRPAPEWLGAPHLAQTVAGISAAQRRHGGQGDRYLARQRKTRGSTTHRIQPGRERVS